MYIIDSEGNKVAAVMRGEIEYVACRRNLVVKYRNSPYTVVIENPDSYILKKYSKEWYDQLKYEDEVAINQGTNRQTKRTNR